MRTIHTFVAVLLLTALTQAQPHAGGDETSDDSWLPKVTKLENGNIKPILEQYKGEVIVLNFWATWCVPCVKEMPDLFKLKQEYESKGMRLILISINDLEELESRVYPFLIEKQVGFETFIRTPGDDQKFINSIDETWSGAIPFTIIFDRAGKKRFVEFGKHTYEEFERAVKPLL